MGRPSDNDQKGICYAWTRWKDFVSQNIEHWAGRDERHALFEPAEAAVAHYLASRNEGGKTAAAGALAGLKKINSAFMTQLPLDKNSVNGWEMQVRGLRPNQ